MATGSLTVKPVTGDELRAALPDLARLRMAVFREFPYLYAGSLDYEQHYLETYVQAPGAFVALARDGERVVGASTALPLTQETAELRRPFEQSGEFDVSEVLYFGESVLLPEYRGRGLGHAFFDQREGYAQQLGLPVTAFCAVQRPDDHPARPTPYRDLHAFWRARGYTERLGLHTTLSWQDLGEQAETPKPMRFWVRRSDV